MPTSAAWRRRADFLTTSESLRPGVTVARISAGQPAKDPGRVSAILEGLRLAGLDEG